MRILLLGAGGQLGQEISRLLPQAIGLSHSQLDLGDAKGLARAFGEHRPQLVINAAAYTAVDRAEEEREQAFEVNCEGAARVAQECARQGLPLVHFSTDYVFPGQGQSAWSESHTCQPVNLYGASKLAGEERVRQLCEQHFIVRVSWLFGSGGHNFVKTILRLAGEREELRVVSDQHGCPTWCGHVAAVVARLIESQQWGTYHYCDAPASSWWEFASEIVDRARHMGWPLKAERVVAIPSSEYPTPAARPACSVLDCSRLQQRLGIEQASWHRGLERTLEQLRP